MLCYQAVCLRVGMVPAWRLQLLCICEEGTLACLARVLQHLECVMDCSISADCPTAFRMGLA